MLTPDDERRGLADRRVVPSVIAAHLIRRLSWRSVLAGTLLALAAQETLGVLGVALGVSGDSAGLWRVLTWVISLIPGAWAAARSAGVPSRADSALHGLFTWAATIVLSQVLLGRLLATAATVSSVTASDALWTFLALLASATAAGVTGWHAASPEITTYPRREFH